MGQFQVYVLESAAGRLYVGQTDDMVRRLSQHNGEGPSFGKYTLKHGPWTLVWSERHPTRASAVQRERQIKKMKSSRWIRETLLSR